ncbi:tyrosine-type recombinase/integrase [Streptomyces sp. WZ-12]|uniref:tyrosine-type recombinase/integrase n=1 Tax=Streptomyces sp. WZ-12 TaxID=3030210 RepID=UPI00238123FF|nr:site-specific integrase [Streptomyces sp. WZ-12]
MTDEKRSRAGNGDDSIYWDKSKNRYIGAISLGFTPAGKRSRPKVSGKTKAEVRAKLREKRKELEVGVKSSATYTIEQAVRAWLSQGLKGRDAGSISTYTSMAENHVIADLGKARLKDLTADTVDCWLDEKSISLAKSSMEMILSILRRSITHAQRRDLILRNVAELVDLPEGQSGRPSKSLTLEQAKSLLTAQRDTWVHVYVAVSLLVGIRTEEVRPLTWDRVHLRPVGGVAPHIEVWRSVRRRGETKTVKSRRTLAMPRQLVETLESYQAEQRKRREGLGLPWTATDLVFGTSSGEQRTAENVRRNFRVLLKGAGFPDPKQWTPRELRHSFVSILSDHGIPLEKIARLVGHSTSQTTEKVYRKQIRPVVTDGAQAMDEIFFRCVDSGTD